MLAVSTAASTSSLPSPGTFFLDAAKKVASVTLPGLIAGFLAFGVGSRLAMRVLALTSRDAVQGAETDAGAIIGEITFGGTMFLIVVGAFLGAGAGLLFLAGRRWLPAEGWKQGLAFGALLLALTGRLLIDPDNLDFLLLDPDWLAVALFGALPLLYGLAFVALHERLRGWIGRDRSPRVTAVLLLPILLPLAIGIFPALIVAIATGIAYIAVRTGMAPRWEHSRLVDAVGRTVLAAVGAVGLWLFASGAAEILT
jgi:hypothetical protein